MKITLSDDTGAHAIVFHSAVEERYTRRELEQAVHGDHAPDTYPAMLHTMLELMKQESVGEE